MSGAEKAGAFDAPLEVFVYYDFASSLSYVAHRVLARIDEQLAEERVELRWKPIDLTGIGSFQRGRLLDLERRLSLIEVATALNVKFDPPERWPDSRLAGEVAVTLDLALDRGLDPAVEQEWRDTAFAAFFEHGEPGSVGVSPASVEQYGLGSVAPERPIVEIEDLFRDFEHRGHFGKHGLASVDDLSAGRRLAAATRSAVAVGVEGVPTLMLDAFPLCGIHDEGTMLGMLQRYARRRRRLETEAAAGVN